MDLHLLKKKLKLTYIKKIFMARYQIVKETSFTGTIQYSIEKDGKYIINSASDDIEKVEKYLQKIISNKEQEIIKETIKTIEIHEN